VSVTTLVPHPNPHSREEAHENQHRDQRDHCRLLLDWPACAGAKQRSRVCGVRCSGGV